MINAIKLILGITIGLLTLGVLTGAAGYYFFVPSITTKPQRPKFAEEGKPKPLPPGAYGGSVTWETGVSLREEPDINSGKSGSVGFREKVTVLKASPDKQWVMVRNSDNSQEGWLKAGNVEREAGN
jgi:hypothetical protein